MARSSSGRFQIIFSATVCLMLLLPMQHRRRQENSGRVSHLRAFSTPFSSRNGIAEANRLWQLGVEDYFAGQLAGRSHDGLDRFEAALQADGTQADRHHFVGALYSSAGREEDAIASWQAAISADPGFHSAYIELVHAHDSVGNYQAAREIASLAASRGAYWNNGMQRPHCFVRGLPSKPWWHAQDFSWVADLEAISHEIRGELMDFLAAQDTEWAGWSTVGHATNYNDDADLVAAGEWREIVLFEDFEDAAAIRAAFSKTREHLRRLLPDAVASAESGMGAIILSAVAPGTHIKPHCSGHNLQLTCHLGLLCPDGAQIRVDETWRTWQQGRCLLFDDSYEHEVKHSGDSLRVVLLINVWHPCIATSQREMAGTLDELAQFDLDQRSCIPPMDVDQKQRVAAQLDDAVSAGRGAERAEWLQANLNWMPMPAAQLQDLEFLE
eukprot:TRINITY_DN77884_c0_g1_i1.p1 TRINITY_DN77884_c0_g1~~TRINITY_DN77884_c0_g1_i1.p1  ORF type:complete len:441 (-),score=79.38 TRINITY_DN77884_c0_g1_i1:27-1349(-)